MARIAGKSYLKPDNLRKIGEALGGTHWQADMAKNERISYSKSMITRILNETRTADLEFVTGLQNVMLDTIEDIARLLLVDDLPDTENMREAKSMILKAVKLARSKTQREAA